MTLREFIAELQKTDERWMDAEVCLFVDDMLDDYYSNPVVSRCADARVKSRKVFVHPDSKDDIHSYNDLIDNEEDKEKEKE